MLIKSLQDIYNQIESKQVELTTFENIREHEMQAIPKRIEVANSVVEWGFFFLFENLNQTFNFQDAQGRK